MMSFNPSPFTSATATWTPPLNVGPYSWNDANRPPVWVCRIEAVRDTQMGIADRYGMNRIDGDPASRDPATPPVKTFRPRP